MFKRFKEDIDSYIQLDPAANSRLEVMLCYSGLHALMFHRVAHAMWIREWRLTARILSNVGKFLSGIEIHPGAKIGKRFFIDHGTGVVIGETAEIGDDVTLYQGVTLGGVSLDEGKRHPTLEDGVIVGSGAKLLGPFIVGAGARVGANAVVLQDVPPGATMVGIPAKVVMKKSDKEFCAYGTPVDMPDPVARTLESLRNEINTLKNRVEELESEAEETQPEPKKKLDVVSSAR
ncbi:serine O-acetyltransferase [Terasakiella sp. A23]|uniref:serine O-acetyltransferase n=1 Tax=Terasakiella sp. FCG-A23 TaxID=3080561 RepID=UPI0029553A70|nr:serine O-acetyltransferase [Terasakiella sp. A23]MDV7339426.1 serine O-acetyltransferase [Terasakiella sp. A23]